MRKYVIHYTLKAYEDKKIDWDTYITKVGCYGLKGLKDTIKELKETIGIEYLEPYIDILTGDGENADYLGSKKIK